MLATLVIKVCTKETASVVLSYWIKSYNITSPCILSCKMIEKVVVCKRSELPVGTIRTFVLSLVTKFSVPFSITHRLIASCIQVGSLTFESYYCTNAWQRYHHDLEKHYEIAQPFPVDSALNLYGIWLVGFLSL